MTVGQRAAGIEGTLYFMCRECMLRGVHAGQECGKKKGSYRFQMHICFRNGPIRLQVKHYREAVGVRVLTVTLLKLPDGEWFFESRNYRSAPVARLWL